MEQTIISLETEGLFLSKKRGLLLASKSKEIIATVPLDDIAALIVSAHGTSYTNSLVVNLTERNIPLVLCGKNHQPEAWIHPIATHFKQAKYLRAQAALTKAKADRLWKQVIVAKISWQIFALEKQGVVSRALQRLARQVRNGDPQNIEAQAARLYWRLMMGLNFRRDTSGGGTNILLNYGYTVLRAAVCRALVAAGLNPCFGIHHHSHVNAFQLVDDLMEPFRPLIDLTVKELALVDGKETNPHTKAELGSFLHHALPDNGTGPVMNHIYRLAIEYRDFITGDAEMIEFATPKAPTPHPKGPRKTSVSTKRISSDVAIGNV